MFNFTTVVFDGTSPTFYFTKEIKYLEGFRHIFYDNWFGFTCPTIRTRARHFFIQLRTFRLHKTRGISWPIKWLL